MVSQLWFWRAEAVRGFFLLVFLVFFLFSANAFSWEKAYDFPFCEKEVLTSQPGTVLETFLSEFQFFENLCSSDCKRKISKFISGWAALNGFSQKKEEMCLLGTIDKNQIDEFVVGIFFPKRKESLFVERPFPIRSEGESVFGPTFFFNSSNCQFVSLKGNDYGPDKKNIICIEIEMPNMILTEKKIFQDYYDNWTLVYMIFNQDGKVEKWWRGKFFKDIDSKIDFKKEKENFSFLDKFFVHFPKKLRNLVSEGYPIEIFLEFETQKDGNLKIKIIQECEEKRWETVYFVNEKTDGRWYKLPYVEIKEE